MNKTNSCQKTKLQYDTLLGVMTCAVVALNDQLRVVYMNQAAEVLLSHSLQRIYGIQIDKLIHNDAFCKQLNTIRSQQEPHAIRAIELMMSPEEQITLDCIVTPQPESQSFGHNWMLLELHQVDRQLKIAREKQLQQQQQALHELVRGLAHEIKNPLGGLRGAAQLLESELTDSTLTEYTQIIISEADRLTMLVNSLLGPGQLPERQSINIHEVLEHVCNLTKAEYGSGIQFERDYDPSIPELSGDRGHLVQACLNVVNNAIHALSGNGSIRLRTRIIRQFTINQTRHKLVLKTDICDNGPGVPDDLKDKLFLPMVSGRADGSGLGLAIAQSLLGRHGGMVQCESTPGSTCFSLLIPLNLGNEQNG
ncbi:MAG: nitrogen regulation protein NR(II) [Thiolinea sp.]